VERLVHIELDGLLRVVGFKEEQLCHDGRGGGLLDFAIETYNSLLCTQIVSLKLRMATTITAGLHLVPLIDGRRYHLERSQL
jgi:hypothetical protein